MRKTVSAEITAHRGRVIVTGPTLLIEDADGQIAVFRAADIGALSQALRAVQEQTAAAKDTAVLSESALLSEAALAEDWNRSDEDEAWSHLQPDR